MPSLDSVRLTASISSGLERSVRRSITTPVDDWQPRRQRHSPAPSSQVADPIARGYRTLRSSVEGQEVLHADHTFGGAAVSAGGPRRTESHAAALRPLAKHRRSPGECTANVDAQAVAVARASLQPAE